MLRRTGYRNERFCGLIMNALSGIVYLVDRASEWVKCIDCAAGYFSNSKVDLKMAHEIMLRRDYETVLRANSA